MRRYRWILFLGTVALISMELGPGAGEHHGESFWHHVPGFQFLYGLLGCAVIVLVSKALGKYWLQKSETYYEEKES